MRRNKSLSRRAGGFFRPVLEQLEERTLLSITYHGGKVLPHPNVEALYYGQYWNGNAALQQASDLNNYLAYLVNSTYMDMLSEYGVGRGTLVDNGIVDNGVSPGVTVDDSQIRQALDSDIAQSFLQAPTANRVYLVFTAPNVDVTDGGQDSLHNFYGYHDSFTSSGGQTIYYAVIANPVGNGDFFNLTDFQTTTKVTSHELAETATDPDGNGWFDSASGDEIGDVCDGQDDVGVLNGYTIQAEWSVKQNACVLPVGAQGSDMPSSAQEIPSPALLTQVTDAFTTSDEYFAKLIVNDYTQLLQRTPSPGELSAWIGAMDQGTTDEQVLAQFTASPEYYQRAGGTNKAWLDALYHDLLGRTPDKAGQDSWLAALGAGTSRTSIAYGFATSTERETQVILNDYQKYLGRSAGATEVNGWVTAFEQGETNEQIVAQFTGSTEYFFAKDGTIESWLTGIYQSLLGRAPDKAGYDAWDIYLESTFPGP
jgi:hypothetical protein